MAIEVQTRIKIETFNDGRERFYPQVKYTGDWNTAWTDYASYSLSRGEAERTLDIVRKIKKIPVATTYVDYP